MYVGRWRTVRLGLDTNAVWVDAGQMMTTRTSDTQTQTSSQDTQPDAKQQKSLSKKISLSDARSAKKDVISTKPQKAMGAERTFPRELNDSGHAIARA